MAAPNDAAAPLEESDQAGRRRTAAATDRLPGAWGRFDRRLIKLTEWTLFVIGTMLATMITLEVISRYVLSFSISFVNAASRLALVWLFLLGAGIALRHGAHVGFELLQSALRPTARRALIIFGLALTLLFCLQMIWAGIISLGPAAAQTEPGLDISLAWPIAAIPVGFVLLAYHVVVIAWVELRPAADDAP